MLLPCRFVPLAPIACMIRMCMPASVGKECRRIFRTFQFPHRSVLRNECSSKVTNGQGHSYCGKLVQKAVTQLCCLIDFFTMVTASNIVSSITILTQTNFQQASEFASVPEQSILNGNRHSVWLKYGM